MPHNTLTLRSNTVTRTEPTTEPVTVEELRSRARLTSPEHDKDLDAIITEARMAIEQVYIRRPILNQVCTDTFNNLGRMELRWGPVVSVTSIEYLDGNESSQTLSTDIYELASDDGTGIIRLKYNQVWPTTLAHPDIATVTYVAGYGATAADIPVPLKSAILALAEWKYEGACDDDLLRSVQDSIEIYKRREYP